MMATAIQSNSEIRVRINIIVVIATVSHASVTSHRTKSLLRDDAHSGYSSPQLPPTWCDGGIINLFSGVKNHLCCPSYCEGQLSVRRQWCSGCCHGVVGGYNECDNPTDVSCPIPDYAPAWKLIAFRHPCRAEGKSLKIITETESRQPMTDPTKLYAWALKDQSGALRELSRSQCAQTCRTHNHCDGIELNGCDHDGRSDGNTQCEGKCYLFYNHGDPLIRGTQNPTDGMMCCQKIPQEIPPSPPPPPPSPLENTKYSIWMHISSKRIR